MLPDNSISISPDDPWALDQLDRKGIADNLTKLIQSFEHPTVMSIGASWGTGKTTFIRMWREDLRKQGYHAIYFNAWENDFAEDPLIALLSEIDIYFSKQIKDSKSKGEQKLDAVLETMGKFVDFLPMVKKFGGDPIIESMPDADQLWEGLQEFECSDELNEKNLQELLRSANKNRLRKYAHDRTIVARFRSVLGYFVRMVKADVGDMPIILFVDELDRCRPTFAIELLERIKHLFNVPGLVFVLSMDREQLAHSVKVIYGSEFEASGYLSRFFDYEYRLPDPDIEKFIRLLIDRYEIASLIESDVEGQDAVNRLVAWWVYTAQCYAMSLRDMLQVANTLRVMLPLLPGVALKYSGYAVFVIAWRKFHIQGFERLGRGELQLDSSSNRGQDEIFGFRNKRVSGGNAIHIQIHYIPARWSPQSNDLSVTKGLQRKVSELRSKATKSTDELERLNVYQRLLSNLDHDIHQIIVDALVFASDVSVPSTE